MRVRGNTLIPPSIHNRFSILCAILRQLHLVLQIALFSSELKHLNPDVFFLDQLSACVPVLRLLFQQVPVLFYCHFPDKLLAYRGGFLKEIYRAPFDFIESWSTGASSTIVVNSEFTRSVFSKAFPGLANRRPQVVYPCVEITAEPPKTSWRKELWPGKKVLLSINRFERKKEVTLAVDAYAAIPPSARRQARLVIAGGHDPRMAENVQYHQELVERAESLGLKTATAKTLVAALAVPQDVEVVFLLSVPGALKTALLDAASLLVYTPKFEHFGIVPLEAMLARVPVLAARTGGPRETVVDGATGWLREHGEVAAWTAVMRGVVDEADERGLVAMGEAGRERVVKLFGQDSMAARLDELMQLTSTKLGPPVLEVWQGVEVGAVAFCGVLLGALAWWLQGLS